MALEKLCVPALIYLVFSITQIVIDTVKGFYNLAFMKFWVSMIFTILLNFLCNKGLGIISWFIVFLPFILMTMIVSILLLMVGLDPLTGKSQKNMDNQMKDVDYVELESKKGVNKTSKSESEFYYRYGNLDYVKNNCGEDIKDVGCPCEDEKDCKSGICDTTNICGEKREVPQDIPDTPDIGEGKTYQYSLIVN